MARAGLGEKEGTGAFGPVAAQRGRDCPQQPGVTNWGLGVGRDSPSPGSEPPPTPTPSRRAPAAGAVPGSQMMVMMMMMRAGLTSQDVARRQSSCHFSRRF